MFWSSPSLRALVLLYIFLFGLTARLHGWQGDDHRLGAEVHPKPTSEGTEAQDNQVEFQGSCARSYPSIGLVNFMCT